VKQNLALQRSGEIARRYRLVGETLVSQGVVKHPVPASLVVDLSYLPQ
jgi:hypothetical protein